MYVLGGQPTPTYCLGTLGLCNALHPSPVTEVIYDGERNENNFVPKTLPSRPFRARGPFALEATNPPPSLLRGYPNAYDPFLKLFSYLACMPNNLSNTDAEKMQNCLCHIM